MEPACRQCCSCTAIGPATTYVCSIFNQPTSIVKNANIMRRMRQNAPSLTSLFTPLIAILAATLLISCKDDPASPVDSQLRVRKNAKNLSAQERLDFTNAILALKNRPSPYEQGLNYYDQFVMWHRNSFYCDTMAAHMGPAFLPWHRQFLLMFENALSEAAGKQITLPYWDWTDNASTQAVFADDLMGGDGNPIEAYAVTTGPFRKGNWAFAVVDQPQADPYGLRYLTRRFGSFPGVPRLPATADIDNAMGVTAYDAAPWDVTPGPAASFRNNLEGWRNNTGEACEDSLMNPLHDSTPTPHVMHNGVHLWVCGMFDVPNVGDSIPGTMAYNTSLNDPVFWLHHANVDRLWAMWENRHGQIYQPVAGGHHGHNLNDNMWPYYKVGLMITPKSMLDHKKLGYRYEVE